LIQIPGVDWLVAAVLIAEIGVDMRVFLSVYHLSAWAGVCPGNHESAGKQKSGRARKGKSTSAPSWSAPRSQPRRPRAVTSRTSTTALAMPRLLRK
jgi:transposase